MTCKEALLAVAVKCPDGYAKAYANKGYSMICNNEAGLQVQLLYVLNNISHWRGELATEVRCTLKEIAKKRPFDGEAN